MSSTQNATAPEKGASPSCQPLLETLTKLGSVWAAHGLRVGRDAVRLGAETLGKTMETLDTLAIALEQRAARKSEPEAAPLADEPPAEPAAAAAEQEHV